MRYTLTTSQGGINLKDPLDVMPEQDCIQMDNIIPSTGADVVRKGYVEVGTDGADNLLGYYVGTTKHIMTCEDEAIYELNTGTMARTLIKDGYDNPNWKQTYFTDGSGTQNVFIANGFDTVQRITSPSGVLTIADSTFTGASNLHSPLSFKNRMYFVEDGTFKLYYGDIQAIGGALTEFDVGGFVNNGGEIQTIASWTQDAGQGIDDLLAIFTTEGEVLIYQGTSPEASDWQLRGNFRISNPIGRNCVTKLGGDLIVITEQGYFPLSQVLNQDRANSVNISDKINPIVEGKSLNGNWNIHWFSKEGWIIVNSPFSNPLQTIYNNEQHILNTKTGAWCRFLGMDAVQWLIMGSDIYFCNSNGVYEANTGTTDNGDAIVYYKQQAYSRFNGEIVKQPLMSKPRYKTGSGVIKTNIRYGIDFKLSNSAPIQSTPAGQQSLWDTSFWDTSFWSQEESVSSFKFNSSVASGEYISYGVFGQTKDILTLYSTEITYRAGDGTV